jgi:hypothetical protein
VLLGREIKPGNKLENFSEADINKISELYFVDCPGLEDTNPWKEFTNQTAVQNVQTKSEQATLLLLFSPD